MMFHVSSFVLIQSSSVRDNPNRFERFHLGIDDDNDDGGEDEDEWHLMARVQCII